MDSKDGPRKAPEPGTLGRRIFDGRQARFLTQAQLAELCQVSQSTIAHWERNSTIPSMRYRELLAGVLGIYARVLFEQVAADEAVSA